MSDDLGVYGGIDRSTHHPWWRSSPPLVELVGDHKQQVIEYLNYLMLDIWQELCTQKDSHD